MRVPKSSQMYSIRSPQVGPPETDSPLYKGYTSLMLYSGLKKKEFADEVFTQGFMARMEELRK